MRNLGFTGRKHTKEAKRKMSIARKQWHELHPDAVSNWQKGRKLSEDTKKKISDSLKGRFVGKKNPRFGVQSNFMKNYFKTHRNPMEGKKWSKKTRKKIIKKHKQMFSDPEYVRKVMRRFQNRPTSLEIDIQRYLDPNEWKYCGDGSVILNGHCPDFININGKKQVILANGLYWHTERVGRTKKQAENVEKKPYDELGYNVIFIWSDDFKRDMLCQ